FPANNHAFFPSATSIPPPKSKNQVKGCAMTATTRPTSEPHVPGAGFKYPVPSAVAMAKAKRRGVSATGPGEGTAASVDGFIVFAPAFAQRPAVRLGDFFFVENRVADDVLFRRPRAQVQQ